MQFKVGKEELVKLLKRITKAVPAHTPMTILENLYIKIKEDGISFRLTAIAMDLESMLSGSIIVTANEGKEFLIDAKLFSDLVNSLKENILNCEIVGEKLIIKTGKGRYDISIRTGVQEYPELLDIGEEGTKAYTVSREELLKAFDYTAHAVSKDDIRPAITGILFNFDAGAGRLEVVATNGHKLCVYPIKTSSELIGQYILPIKAINLIKDFGGEKYEIGLSSYALQLKDDTATLTVRLIGSKYPSYQLVAPKSYAIKVHIDRSQFLAALNRALIFVPNTPNAASDTRKGKLTLFNNQLTVSTVNLDIGAESEERLTADYHDAKFDIAFNFPYLQKILTVTESDTVVIKLNTPASAAVFQGKEEDSYSLVMPVRLTTED